MVAAAAVDEVQMTEVVTSCVLESLKVPVAVNCLVVPTAMLEFAGVTASETRVALVTVNDAFPLTDPEVAGVGGCALSGVVEKAGRAKVGVGVSEKKLGKQNTISGA